MRMLLSADGRYYHGQSKTDGYVFVEVAVADRLHQEWLQSHLRAPENLKLTMETLHASASFWDMALIKGAHTLQRYMKVELLTPHHYRVSCMDHEQLLWDYALEDIQLQHWLPTVSRLVQTSIDPLCGIYMLPEGTTPLPWDVSST
jgi:hypothetical protein